MRSRVLGFIEQSHTVAPKGTNYRPVKHSSDLVNQMR
jgi:hypothetical protein